MTTLYSIDIADDTSDNSSRDTDIGSEGRSKPEAAAMNGVERRSKCVKMRQNASK